MVEQAGARERDVEDAAEAGEGHGSSAVKEVVAENTQDVDVEMERDAVTPLPWGQMIVLAIITFSEPMNQVILFPFVVFMVEGFGVAKSEEKVGFYVGIVASSFAVTQFLSAMPWGMLSDRFGRRPILLTGLLGTAAAMIAFGLSTSYWMAVATRSLSGLLNGNIGVAKSVLGEITDKTNQSRAFSVFGFVYGLGFIVGPFLGGFLADPADKYSFLDNSFFRKFPYFLPCAVSASVSMTGFIMGLSFLKETLGSRKKESVVVEQSDRKSYGALDNGKADDSKGEEVVVEEQVKKKNLIWEVLKISNFTVSSVLYAMIGFVTIYFDELFGIWAATSASDGGLDFEEGSIGLALTSGGVALLVSQVFLYPPITKRAGARWTYRMGSVILFFCYIVFPQTSYVHRSGASVAYVWAMLIVMFSVRAFANSCVFTTSFILINNSVRPALLGTANGIGQMAAAGARAAGPFLAGTMFSFSISNDLPFPLNFQLSFMFCGFVCVLALLLTFKLTPSIDHPYLSLLGLDAT